jgi:hypothetical protein
MAAAFLLPFLGTLGGGLAFDPVLSLGKKIFGSKKSSQTPQTLGDDDNSTP